MNKIFTLLFLLPALVIHGQHTLHIQTDKQLYYGGEQIWFKAHARSNSSNLYVGLYNPSGKLLQQKQYPVIDGTAAGDFLLPDSIGSSCVVLYAQLGDGAVSRQRLQILGDTTALPVVPGGVKLQAYAEGGQLIGGVSNYVALRTTLPNGRGYSISGSIRGEGLEPVSFRTNDKGIGYIQWMPEAGISYYAHWQNEAGQWVQTPLPTVQASGVVLHTQQSGQQLFYHIQSVGSQGACFVVIQQGGSLLYKSEVALTDGARIVNQITTDSLTGGPVYVTVSNTAGQVLARRVVIINPVGSDTLIQLVNHQKDWTPKAQQAITLRLPAMGSYAVSIADAGFGSMGNITTAWPEADADVWALTQEWPEWQNSDAGRYLGLGFSSKGKGFGSKEQLNVMIKDKTGSKLFDNVSAQGNSFYQQGYVYYDTARVYYQLTQDKDRITDIALTAANPSPLPLQIAEEVNYSLPAAAVLPGGDGVESIAAPKGFSSPVKKSFNAEQVLQEVRVKSKRWANPETIRMQELDNKYATGPFRGLARGFQVNLLDDPNVEAAIDIYNYIAFKVGGLVVKYDGMNGKQFISRDGPPLIFIDEVESPNEVLQTIPITQVAYVKFIPGLIVGLSFVTKAGAVYVYTKKGNEALPPAKNMRIAKVKGYDLPRDFTQPDYSDKANRQNADMRSTLYWNPYLQADEDGSRCTINFYNNDLSKRLLLTVQGVDGEGRPVYWQRVLE